MAVLTMNYLVLHNPFAYHAAARDKCVFKIDSIKTRCDLNAVQAWMNAKCMVA